MNLGRSPVPCGYFITLLLLVCCHNYSLSLGHFLPIHLSCQFLALFYSNGSSSIVVTGDSGLYWLNLFWNDSVTPIVKTICGPFFVQMYILKCFCSLLLLVTITFSLCYYLCSALISCCLSVYTQFAWSVKEVLKLPHYRQVSNLRLIGLS